MEDTYPTQLINDFFRAKAASYISPMALKKMLDEGTQEIVLLDVRLQSPALKWRIPHAISMPLPQVKNEISNLPKDKLIVLICWDTWCSLATSAALILLDAGFRVKELSGGVAAWEALGLPKEHVTVEPAEEVVCTC